MKRMFLLLCTLVIGSYAFAGSDRIPTRVDADAGHPPMLEDGEGLYTLNYHLIHREVADDLARLVRSFTPPTSRIFGKSESGALEVTDTAASLRRVYILVRENDLTPTLEVKRKWRKMEEVEDTRHHPALPNL